MKNVQLNNQNESLTYIVIYKICFFTEKSYLINNIIIQIKESNAKNCKKIIAS